MEEGIKKRLIGAAVLASLAIIFIPMLIDDQSADNTALREIPVEPVRQAFASSMLREEVVKPQLPRAVVVAEPEPEIDDGKAPAPKIKAKPRTGLNAWVVQVGSFSSRNNANKLVAKLRKAGFQTKDAERVEMRGKTLYRVSVGPVVEKAKAKKLLPKINKVAGVKSRIRSYP